MMTCLSVAKWTWYRPESIEDIVFERTPTFLLWDKGQWLIDRFDALDGLRTQANRDVIHASAHPELGPWPNWMSL